MHRLFTAQPREWIFAETVLLILLTGFLDFWTGYQMSLSILYAAPIFIAAWFCDKRLGLLAALISGLTWWWADTEAGHLYLQNWMQGWETFVRISFFLIVSIGTSALRAQREIDAARIALLEHSQHLEQQIIEISEREQRRIGQDLHDGLCQFLAAIGCAAASLKNDLAKQQLPKEANLADELATLLQESVVQARNLAHGLAPMHIDEIGLSAALEGLALSATRLLAVDCTFESRGQTVVPEAAATHLYRIAQEAINNATRHGNASKIALSLTTRQGCTQLRIADDGRGMSNSASNTPGIGLSIMHYRAHLAGGELRIDEPNGRGTAVTCTMTERFEHLHERAA